MSRSHHDASRYATPGKSLPDRLAYLSLAEADADRLRALSPVFQSFAGPLVEAFYRHLFASPDAAKFLGDPELVARLKQAQHDHFLSLLDARWDDEYVARRNRVGEAHAHVGSRFYVRLRRRPDAATSAGDLNQNTM